VVPVWVVPISVVPVSVVPVSEVPVSEVPVPVLPAMFVSATGSSATGGSASVGSRGAVVVSVKSGPVECLGAICSGSAAFCRQAQRVRPQPNANPACEVPCIRSLAWRGIGTATAKVKDWRRQRRMFAPGRGRYAGVGLSSRSNLPGRSDGTQVRILTPPARTTRIACMDQMQTEWHRPPTSAGSGGDRTFGRGPVRR
jgi:hypothetical protein